MNKPSELTVKVNVDTEDLQRKLRIISRHFELLARELEEEETYEVATDVHCDISCPLDDFAKAIDKALGSMNCPRLNNC